MPIRRNYLIDIAAGIVVDVEATPAHKIDEINATKTMIERVEERFHCWRRPRIDPLSGVMPI